MGIPLYREEEENVRSDRKQNVKLLRAINDRSRSLLEDQSCDEAHESTTDRLLSLQEFLRGSWRRPPSTPSQSGASRRHGGHADGYGRTSVVRSDDETFQSLLSQIRSLGEAHDNSLLIESSPEASDSSLQMREARLRAMRSRIDALGQRLTLVRSARAELRRVESEAMHGLEQMSEGHF